TDTKGRLSSYEWSPDSKKLALVIGDPDPDAPENPENGGGNNNAANNNGGGRGGRGGQAPKPIVIDRYKFKQDVQGYLLSGRHSYIYIYDVAAKKTERLTTQKKWDEGGPSWSPDGKWIAFTSNHRDDPDRTPGAQVYVAEAKAEAAEKPITPVGEVGASGGGGGGRGGGRKSGAWAQILLG